MSGGSFIISLKVPHGSPGYDRFVTHFCLRVNTDHREEFGGGKVSYRMRKHAKKPERGTREISGAILIRPQ